MNQDKHRTVNRGRNLIGAAVATGVIILASGCATRPETHSGLTVLQTRYENTTTRQYASKQAASELRETREALEEGREAWQDNDDEALAHYMLVADKTLDIADERIDLFVTKQEIASANTRRSDMVLAAREQEIREKEVALAAQEAALAVQQEQLRMSRLQAQELESQLDDAQNQANMLASRLDEVEATRDERGTVLVLKDILFEFDSADLRSESRSVFDEIATYLSNQEAGDIIIEGHTDSVGSESYNEALSLDRARSVKNALLDAGIPDDRMSLEAMGESTPVASNDSSSGRQMNRRVEIVIENPEEGIARR